MSAGAIVINAAIQFGIGMGLHAIGTLLEKDAKQRITVSDDKPPSTSTRGSWIPNVLGRRRIGPYIAWVGDQTTINEQQGSTIVEIVQESAWHIISTGPCDVLHKIYAGGSILFKGNVNRNSHPSGSTVDLGEFGSFNIYWGETNQPINTFLQGTFDPTTGLFDRTGVASRWPNVCYIQWNNFRVGNQSTWPLLEYDIERRPAETKLTNGTTPEISSDPAYFPGTIPASPIFDLGASTGLSIVIATDENGGYIALTDKHYGLPNESDPDGGDFTHIFIRGTKIFMSQPNADPNGYTIKHSTYFPFFIGATPYPKSRGRAISHSLNAVRLSRNWNVARRSSICSAESVNLRFRRNRSSHGAPRIPALLDNRAAYAEKGSLSSTTNRCSRSSIGSRPPE